MTQINATYFAFAILMSATIFVIAWSLDAITHTRLVKIDITDKELQTHRILILSSGLMELCLVLMYWFDIEILPIFIAALVTRTAHEFIDELRYHTDRCTFRETLLHLIMWISVISKTGFLFIWGFYFKVLFKNISHVFIQTYHFRILLLTFSCILFKCFRHSFQIFEMTNCSIFLHPITTFI